MKQLYNSASTSVNSKTAPTAFKKCCIKPGEIVLDSVYRICFKPLEKRYDIIHKVPDDIWEMLLKMRQPQHTLKRKKGRYENVNK